MNKIVANLAPLLFLPLVAAGCAVEPTDADASPAEELGTAQAALNVVPGADLRFNAFTQTLRTNVDAYQQFSITVQNYGSATASGAVLRINLLATQTSPTAYLLGQLQALPSGCSAAGRVVTCQLGNIAHNGPQAGRRRTINFGYRIPVTTQALGLTASVSSASEPAPNATDNTSSLTANVNYRSPAVTTGSKTASHCTGTNLTAYFECTKFPSSIMSHEAEYHANGTITFPGYPGYTGTWSKPDPTSLHVEYSNGSFSELVFDGRGADGSCFEGISNFFEDDDGNPSTAPVQSTYNSGYRICF